MLRFHERLAFRLRPAELGVLWKFVTCVRRREAAARGARFWVDPASNFGCRVLEEGDYEPAFADRLLALLRPGDVFCDLGANEGVFTVWASGRVGPSGRVLCVEPQRRLWPVILRNLQLNLCANVALLPFAVGEREGEAVLSLFPSTNTGATSLVGSARSRFSASQSTPVFPLSALLEAQGVNAVDVLKIDIEGFELFALRGLGSWLDPLRIRNIFVELHPAQLSALGQTTDELHALLTQAGYRRICSGDVEHWAK